MKKQIVLIGAMLFSSGAFASHFNGDPELEQSILNDHTKEGSQVIPQAGEDDMYGSVLLEKSTDARDRSRERAVTLQQGSADMYGSVLFDVRMN